jgi:(1->4)-alpha-D-glucan 1-alpha-D-glucosylmutase
VGEFHAAQAVRQHGQPRSMTTLSTHDTKRGEDVRARLAVLAECPDEWRAVFGACSAATATLGDPDFAQLLWQTVVGAWPIERDRLHAYVEKAAREQATWTTWDSPNIEVERVLHEVVDAVYDLPAVRDTVDAFVNRITPYGWSNSLGQKLIQLTMPGVPDTYQGTELWDNSLVDPDNRRPVDFAARRELLARLDTGWLPPVDPGGAAKLLVTSRALRLRRDSPEVFTGYTPIDAGEHAVAFDRGGAVTVATRLPLTLHARGGFAPHELLPLPPGDWHDLLTDRPVSSPALADLLDRYPVALLIRAGGGGQG